MEQISRNTFLDRFGGIYEHSAWIAEMLFDRKGHYTAEKPSDLAGPMAKIVETAPQELQMALLRAHPDLAGKLAVSASSKSEQASAQLDQCSQGELDAFTALNASYREKFNFPFILAVRDRNRAEILENFKKRVAYDVGTEFREALNQVHQIAKLRLEALGA
ncbi:MAG: 2-oxo-4-hydroxy-4-carboxy-5-ureidoimidazoline decarboxylase [Amylibacter sp.]|nr:2-oxo-4-hydroxy-4-carboxy-5-ureidoimidazoline decarboxylase [Amylibacter sp.]